MGLLNLLEAASMFAGMAATLDHVKHGALDRGAKILQDESKRVLGTYDYGWPQLQASTQRARERQGYTPNDPLLVTGDLRDSIERDVQEHVAYVGSNNDKALWHEYGTSRIPPRPFFAGAIAAKHEEIGELIAKSHFDALVSKA